MNMYDSVNKSLFDDITDTVEMVGNDIYLNNRYLYTANGNLKNVSIFKKEYISKGKVFLKTFTIEIIDDDNFSKVAELYVSPKDLYERVKSDTYETGEYLEFIKSVEARLIIRSDKSDKDVLDIGIDVLDIVSKDLNLDNLSKELNFDNLMFLVPEAIKNKYKDNKNIIYLFIILNTDNGIKARLSDNALDRLEKIYDNNIC